MTAHASQLGRPPRWSSGLVSRSVYQVRRKATEWWGLVVVAGCGILLGLGQFSGPGLLRGDLWMISALLVYAITLGRAVLHEVDTSAPRGKSELENGMRELELGLLLLTGVYLLVMATGGSRSFLYPLVYALISFLLVLHQRRWVAGGWIAAACGLEVLAGHATGASWLVVGYHITFIGFFAAGNFLILASLARRLRSGHGRAVSAELARIRQEARDFRLIASQLPLASRAQRSREEEELRMAHGAVHAVHEQLFFNIDLLCASLNLHTAALLWVRPEETTGRGSRAVPRLVIKEMATASELVRDIPDIDQPGVLAALLRDPKPLRLKSLGGRRVPPYYQGPEKVTDLVAVPLMEGAVLRGILCADRIDDQPFTDQEEALLVKAAGQVMRVVEQERSFAAVERGKYEQEKFYSASELLNQALTLEDVTGKTFAALAAISPYDLAVVSSYDENAAAHEVLAVRVADDATDKQWPKVAARLERRRVGDGPSLISMAVKNRHHMPASGDMLDSETIVFDDETRLAAARSVLVLPLVRGDQVVGTITLASSRSGAYPIKTREMLRVISHQVGVSLENARMYQSMEERATKDGLTGLTNHRAFQERLDQLHALAERTKQKFSIVLTDIDHFKGVNDTYGHPVGDQVLKRVAAVFAGRARKVDIVARYGGEEFVIVLPDCDGLGAENFANKLREEVEAQTMTSEHGSFNVTLSLGIAEFPGDSEDRHELIEKADQALYYCKEHGRNRVTRFAAM